MNVYLDNNSTTPLHEEVLYAMKDSLSIYENPSSSYSSGIKNRKLIFEAKQKCASLINADADCLIFTSCGTESNNTVLNYSHLKRIIDRNKERNEVVISTTEHHSVLNCAKALEQSGIKVYYAPVDTKGKIIIDQFKSLVSERTALVSVMLANNETGTIQDIKKLVSITHKKGALFHTDAVQAIGKMHVDVRELDVDYLSYAAHKFYGPKGAGILYIKEHAPFTPLFYGGKQQMGRRSGTENIPGIIGMGKAAEIVQSNIDSWEKKNRILKQKLVEGINHSITDVIINGDQDNCLAQTLNISFIGAEAETILVYLDNAGISVSTGAACNSGLTSHVLNAMGLDKKIVNSAIRFSFGYHNTEEQIEYTVREIQKIISRIRQI